MNTTSIKRIREKDPYRLNKVMIPKIRKNIVSLIPGLIILMPVFSQEADYFMGPVRYSFINYDHNIIQLPENDTTFKKLFLRFDSLITFGTGKIQILHMGGSHIQADIYTHVMRTRLQSLSKDMNGGRGLIFPYRIARTNNPSNYSVSYTGNWKYSKSTQLNSGCKLGLTGMAVITTDSLSSITINPNKTDSTHYTFDKVRIFHEPSAYRLLAITGDSIITGQYDSINGCSVFEFSCPERLLHIRILKDTVSQDASFTLSGIDLVSNSSGVVYNSVGVNGAMLGSYLQCELYQKHLKAIRPDLIIISIGTNDGYTRRFDEDKYLNEYRELLSRTIEATPEAALMLTVPNDSYLYRRYVNPNTEKMKNIIREVAGEYHCAVWDFYTVMGGLNSSQTWFSLNLMRYDRIHFNQNGYQLKGDLLFSAFLKAWENQLADFKTFTDTNTGE